MIGSIRNFLMISCAAGAYLLAAPGCQPDNPNAKVEAPIITDDAPKNSEEAAIRSEPPPQKYRGK